MNDQLAMRMETWMKFAVMVLLLRGSMASATGQPYSDGRPAATLRMDAKDHGIVLRYGDGPDKCDTLGARDVWVYQDNGTYYMHYDAAGPTGWLCALAISKDLLTWEKKGPILDLGQPGEGDSKGACYGVTYHNGKQWHMFYLGTPNVTPAPNLIPGFPYLTMKAKGKGPAGPWIKQKSVVPFRPKPGTYYSATASPGQVIRHGKEYLQFFSASTQQGGIKRTLGIARTKNLDGEWTIDPKPIVPLEEQIENSTLYYEESNKTWFLFTNHIGIDPGEYTDAIWVYWSKDLTQWDAKNKAVVLDGQNCNWSKKCIGLPSVVEVGKRLAIFYDAPGGNSTSHMKRHVGLAWLELPLAVPDNKASAVGTEPLRSVDLRCEYLTDPLGIDVAKPRLSWIVKSDQRGQKQTAYQVLVASSREKLDKNQGDLWDSGKVQSDQSLNVVYNGNALTSRGQYFWKVRAWPALRNLGEGGDGSGGVPPWSKPGSWSMGILSQDAWQGQWIQSDLSLYDYQVELRKVPDHELEIEKMENGRDIRVRAAEIHKMTARVTEAPAVWMRKEFNSAGKKPRRATLYISGLGLYEPYLNGNKINDHLLNVSPHDFGKTVPYHVHDVTAHVRNGENTLGVILGNGYFNPVIPSLLREYAFDFIDTPRLRCELQVEYENGSTQHVVSDTSWKFTTDGPIRFNSIRSGETYDARNELGLWSAAGYDDHNWKPARTANAPRGRMLQRTLPPVRKLRTIPAVSVEAHQQGYRFDIGEDSTGWARLKLRGKAGQRVVIKYPGAGSHTLGRYQTCEYICKGTGDELFEPRFAFNGYRHVDVEGLDYTPVATDLVGFQVVSDLQTVGSFSCSDERINILQQVNLRTIQNYNVTMPMDPVREKVCWTQDVQSNFETSAYNYNLYGIYRKWQDDYIDSVLANGFVPTVVPSCFDGPTINGPWWGGMLIFNPWQLYNFYGDKEILSKSYDAMKHHMTYYDSIAKDNIVSWGLGDWQDAVAQTKGYGNPKSTTVPYTSTCAYFHYADILHRTALLVGKPDDAAHYKRKMEAIRKSLHEKFHDAETGVYDKGSQTAYVLALRLNVAEENERPRIVENLKRQIAKDNNHLSAGFVGLPFLLTQLTEEGLGDLAWTIATQETYPSWYDMIFNKQKTAFMEAWDGGMVQMPSLAGSIGAWFYRSLGGIRSDGPGFKSFVVAPYTKALDWVKCEYKSPYGQIASNWSKKNGCLTMHITVPANTTATVHVPGKSITEGGLPAANAEGVTFLRMEMGKSLFKVSSGKYEFKSVVKGNEPTTEGAR